MNPVRIAFVGVGGMGQCAHLRNFVTTPDCDVVALAELRPDLAQRVAAKYSIEKVYESHTDLLANESVDGIVCAQPYSRHGVLLPDLYDAGVTVFTEKPLGRSVEVGEALVAALSRSKARHLVGYHKRSDPATMYAKAEIERLKSTGELGALRYVRILMPAGDWIANGFRHLLSSDEKLPDLAFDAPPSDMDEPTAQAYDIFVNYYIHQVNLMRHLLGEAYHVSYADPTGVVMTVHSDSGVAGTIEMSPYQTTIDWQEEALVAFDKGFVRIQLPAPLASNRPGRVTIYRDPGDNATPERIEPQLPWVHAMAQQAENVVRAIRGEQTPLCEAADALEDLRVAREYIAMMPPP